MVISMQFYKHLYVGKTIKNPIKVKRKLKMGAGQLHIYVIALAQGADQLEIYHCAYLQQSYYKQNPPDIIGIAGSYEEAVEIVRQIAEAAVLSSGTCDIKNFLLQQQ